MALKPKQWWHDKERVKPKWRSQDKERLKLKWQWQMVRGQRKDETEMTVTDGDRTSKEWNWSDSNRTRKGWNWSDSNRTSKKLNWSDSNRTSKKWNWSDGDRTWVKPEWLTGYVWQNKIWGLTAELHYAFDGLVGLGVRPWLLRYSVGTTGKVGEDDPSHATCSMPPATSLLAQDDVVITRFCYVQWAVKARGSGANRHVYVTSPMTRSPTWPHLSKKQAH